MKRVLSKNAHAKATNEPRQYTYADADDSKARHILGLDVTHLRLSRRDSISSASTSKLRSVTFSNATTAAMTVTDSSQSGRETSSSLSRKGSSPLLRRNKKTDAHTDPLKPKISGSSLRSFYDKSRAPLSVSQQTSESSRRDFALRKGAPLIVSPSTQETEHSRQIRLMAEPSKGSLHDSSKLSPLVTRFSNSSSRSLVPSVPETASDTAESLSSQPSGSRISILRNVAPRTSVIPPAPAKVEPYFQKVKPDMDPARAKINVRRPKAGTKNWFDSLDTDSSEDEDMHREPHLTDDFALHITRTLHKGQVERAPSSSLSNTPAKMPVELPGSTYLVQHNIQPHSELESSVDSEGLRDKPSRKRKMGRFASVNLANQSILELESSEDEDQSNSSERTPQTSVKRGVAPSPFGVPCNSARVENHRPRLSTTASPQKAPQQMRRDYSVRQPVPRRISSRMITYLDDCSTETVTQEEDLLTSFPQTPTDCTSRSSSLREHTVSEDEGSLNTKLMTVTRQEESLIAAMRLKKTAMKRAQAIAHRQSALSTLERSSTSTSARLSPSGQRNDLGGSSKPRSPSTQPGTHRVIPSIQHSQRTDSVTTFQTDSVRQPSIRSSIATYLSEGSEDLRLPYSLSDGLPMGSTHLRRASSTTSDRPQSNRDTFLSEQSISTFTASPSDWSPSVRGSHVVELDPLDRQLSRGEIPSQLFLERPFIGWEAQASMQRAH